MFECFKNNEVIFSLEVFPPKINSDVQNIYNSLQYFSKLEPNFISVTYGAGGNGSSLTFDIAKHIQDNYNIESVAHLTAAGASKEFVFNMLSKFKQNNIKNILALRGDNKDNEIKDFKYATDLIEFIAKDSYFNICAACYPEGHIESKNFKQDIDILKLKANLGVTHFISQLFFDNEDFYKMLEAMDYANIKTPVQAGIMPVTNANQIKKMIALSGAKLPSKLTKILARYEHNSDALKIAGLNYAIEQINDLLANNIRGIHLYTMNNPSTAEYIMSNILPLIRCLNNKK